MSSQKEPSFVYLVIDELGQFSTWIQTKVIFCCCTHSSQHVNIYINIEEKHCYFTYWHKVVVCLVKFWIIPGIYLHYSFYWATCIYFYPVKVTCPTYRIDGWTAGQPHAYHLIYTDPQLLCYPQYLQYLHLYLLTSRSCCCGAGRRARWRWWWRRSSPRSTETSHPRPLLQHPHH